MLWPPPALPLAKHKPRNYWATRELEQKSALFPTKMSKGGERYFEGEREGGIEGSGVRDGQVARDVEICSSQPITARSRVRSFLLRDVKLKLS